MAGVATGSDASGERGTDAASRPSTRIRAALAVGLVLLTAVAYAPVFGADFVSYDDDKYVTANPMVQQGLGAEGVRWAFTSVHDANWIPLVWVSLMVDHQLWGLDAGGYHATNVGLHAISALLLLAALSRLTGAFGPSLFVAILFALHPLHVQSVAWVSERKDTLSGLFWMATLLGYAHYVARPSLGRYLAVGLLFALGLLSKATLVTLPFVLLLLDAWPAARIDAADRARALRRGAVLVAEKLPLFALAAAASFVTLSAQTGGGARAMGHLDLGQRAANAIVAYITYLWKTLWPFDLAFFYPHGEWLPTSPEVLGSAALLVTVTGVLGFWAARSRDGAAPLVGWLWYLGTLVPMLGLVQVGAQGMADRYTYVPLVGIGIALAWGVPARMPRSDATRGATLMTFAVVCTVAWTGLTFWQATHWRDSERLYRRALEIDVDNYNAHYELARVLNVAGRFDEAEHHAGEAVRIVPVWSDAYLNLGVARAGRGRHEEAVVALRRAVARDPGSRDARLHLAASLAALDRTDEARLELQRWLGRNPTDVTARLSLAGVEEVAGDRPDAIRHFQRVLVDAPGTAEATFAASRIVQIVDGWPEAPRTSVAQARELADALTAIEPETWAPLAERLAERARAPAP